MNLSFVQKVLTIVIAITLNCEAKDACDYSCLSKTYSYKEVSATFTAKQINGINLMTIDLVGNNIKQSKLQQISVIINRNYKNNEYYCKLNEAGQTSAFVSNPVTLVNNGSSIYQHNKLYCSWTMSSTDVTWPMDVYDIPLNLEFDYNSKIILTNVNHDRSMVAEDTKELPIYGMNFLKCCYKLYGNDKVQLFVRQTDDSNDFNVFPSADSVSYVTVLFTGSDSSSFGFDIYYSGDYIDGYIKLHGNPTFYFNSQFFYQEISYEEVGIWSIPLIINASSSQYYDTKDRVFDLLVGIDGTTVYTKKGITLKSSGSIQITNIFILISTFIIHHIICY